MKSFKFLGLGLLAFVAFGCHKSASRLGIDPAAAFKASAVVTDSFAVDQSHVVIKKSALDKEFLLSSNMLSQTPTPMFSTLQSRVVSFILRDHRVYLLDVTKNHLVGSDNIPQNLLLAQFNILSETDLALTIDFNEGMTKIFTAGDMFASDDPEFKGAEYTLPIAKVTMSYLDELKINGQALFIRQVAQIEKISEKQAVSVVPVEVRYQLAPYLPDASFVPVRSPGFDKVGYFEANALLLKDGTTALYATKWNEKKPMVFAISANTPANYRELVRDAVLYWNKILGDNKVQVIQLDDKSITAPSYNYNIIQWADFDAAGYAFADMHIDPRSGEVTSAQVFFPTAFTESLVPKRIRLAAGEAKAARAKQVQVGLRGFTSARVCMRDIYKDLAGMQLPTDLASITPEAMDKAMRDYVYEVIAHEVGHVLGLRHNFAGNLVANYDFKDRKEMILSYYQNQKAPSVSFGQQVLDSSSVMEYSRFEESSWNGDMLRKAGSKALTYDEMAIRHLYFGEAIPDNRPPFCTDSGVETYADCNTSDAGRSVISSVLGTYQFNLDSLAARVMNLYISKSKYTDEAGQQVIPVSQVDLNAKTIVKTLGIDLAKFVSLMKVNTKFIAVRYTDLPALATNEPTMQASEQAYLQNEVNRLGGLAKATAAIPADYATQLQSRFATLLDDPYYNSGTLRDGTSYSFSDYEKKIMKAQMALFSVQMQNEFILNEIKALSGEKFSFEASYGQAAPEEKTKWADSDLTADLAQVLLARFNYYTFSPAANKIATDVVTNDGARTKVELPTYVFSQEIRNSAATLFSTEASAIDWAYLEKAEATKRTEAELALLGDEEKIDKASLTKDALKWFLFNKQIESTLSK